MKHKFITPAVILVCTFSAYTQQGKKRSYFPAWTYHQKNINIYGVSVGIGTLRDAPKNTNTNGIKVELIGAGVLLPMASIHIVADNDSSFEKLAAEPISERINGISLSASGTVCDCITNGLNAGFVGNYNYRVNGVSISLYGNFAQIHNGLQLGIYNITYKMKGVQIGIWNVARKFKGVQIGIFNFNGKRILPFINWNF